MQQRAYFKQKIFNFRFYLQIWFQFRCKHLRYFMHLTPKLSLHNLVLVSFMPIIYGNIYCENSRLKLVIHNPHYVTERTWTMDVALLWNETHHGAGEAEGGGGGVVSSVAHLLGLDHPRFRVAKDNGRVGVRKGTISVVSRVGTKITEQGGPNGFYTVIHNFWQTSS